MTKAESIIRRTISEHNLIEKGDHIVIGLSGGPDSVCLFDVLCRMPGEMELTIHPVHINHMFRPGAAEDDQAFVENLCESRGVPARSFVIDCNALADRLGMTSEEAGRKARYDTFFECAENIQEHFGKGEAAFASKVKIAVAQNANDQAETILFRILRGTGTDGLAGIAYEREERRGDRAFKVVRPLLDVWRDDIEEHCLEYGLDPVRDHTNEEEIYSRNKIRLDLIPYIEEKYNSNLKEGLVRLGHIAASDKDYFWRETCRVMDEIRLLTDTAGNAFGEDCVVLKREELAACHEAIRHRVMLKAFGDIGLTRDITAERLEAADAIIGKKQGEKMVEFPHGYRLTVARGRAVFEKGVK
ncbi:MAG: tRNA lysidine(34) synthetase TilS [Clostridia bacterium]|nr:tRNA lysidine(34) synthetase TilS [Clostridia bacterium]